jgi:hypothetical protein
LLAPHAPHAHSTRPHTQHKSCGKRIMITRQLSRLHHVHISPFKLAVSSGELSRVSQVPFLRASFWQGLRFAVQNASDTIALFNVGVMGASVPFLFGRRYRFQHESWLARAIGPCLHKARSNAGYRVVNGQSFVLSPLWSAHALQHNCLEKWFAARSIATMTRSRLHVLSSFLKKPHFSPATYRVAHPTEARLS